MERADSITSPGGWWRTLWHKNFLGLIPYTFVTPRGYRIACRRRYEIRMCEKIFTCRQYPLDQLPVPIHTVLDVGANIGVFSLFCADYFGATVKHIIAVEPFAKNYRRICATVRQNRLGELIHPVNQAVSDAPGNANLLLADSHYSHSLNAAKVKNPNSAQPVEVTTLNELKRKHQLATIDLLKLDVEGSELRVLEGGRDVLTVTNALVIEAHKGFCSFGDLKERLAPYNLLPLPGTRAADSDHGDFCFCRGL